MSELKAYRVKGVTLGDTHDVYLKSEADKVIAEKDAKTIQLEALIENYNRISREIIDNANHQKRKRCLAMADMCNAKYDEEDAKVNGCGASWEYISKEMKFWERWQKRWLKLADKFKEAK